MAVYCQTPVNPPPPPTRSPSLEILYLAMRAAVERSTTGVEFGVAMDSFRKERSPTKRRTFLSAAATTRNDTQRQELARSL